jgi:hypothetical protein
MRFLEASCARFAEIKKVSKDGKCPNCERVEKEAKENEEDERKMREMELWRRRWKSPEARATEARRLALEASMDRRKKDNEYASGRSKLGVETDGKGDRRPIA